MKKLLVSQWRRNLMAPVLALGALAGGTLLTGCRVGSATFTSTVPGVVFEPNGTVFSYLDAHDQNLVEDDNPPVVVVMTWIVFDPAGDLNDVDGGSLEDMRHELELRDAVSLVFDEQKDVDPGEGFTAVLEGNEVVDTDGVSAHVHFAPERLSSSSTYADIKPLASRRTVKVAIEQASFSEGSAVVAGTLAIELKATGQDPGAALEGRIEGTFTAPVVSERTAEQNLAILDVHPLLGVPAREEP
jgi:hypothetical protein